MDQTADIEEWKRILWPIVEIKAEEFALLGYGKVDIEEVWKCITDKVARKRMEEPLRLHQLVNDGLSMSVNDYMNRLRMESLRGPDWFAEGKPLNLDEFDDSSP